jgi:hypothetical protein
VLVEFEPGKTPGWDFFSMQDEPGGMFWPKGGCRRAGFPEPLFPRPGRGWSGAHFMTPSEIGRRARRGDRVAVLAATIITLNGPVAHSADTQLDCLARDTT